MLVDGADQLQKSIVKCRSILPNLVVLSQNLTSDRIIGDNRQLTEVGGIHYLVSQFAAIPRVTLSLSLGLPFLVNHPDILGVGKRPSPKKLLKQFGFEIGSRQTLIDRNSLQGAVIDSMCNRTTNISVSRLNRNL